jgi:hypothetical protein
MLTGFMFMVGIMAFFLTVYAFVRLAAFFHTHWEIISTAVLVGGLLAIVLTHPNGRADFAKYDLWSSRGP